MSNLLASSHAERDIRFEVSRQIKPVERVDWSESIDLVHLQKESRHQSPSPLCKAPVRFAKHSSQEAGLEFWGNKAKKVNPRQWSPRFPRAVGLLATYWTLDHIVSVTPSRSSSLSEAYA